MGVPQETANIGAKVLSCLTCNHTDIEWSIFAYLDGVPPILELWHHDSATTIEISIIR